MFIRSGARIMSQLLKAMRLRRAVPKTPAKSSVPLGSPLNKLRPLPTHSESTLPQPLIPRNFISFISNVYRKPGEESPRLSPKVCQLVTRSSPLLRARTNSRNPITLIHLLHNSRTPRGWGISPWDSQSWLSPPVFRITGRETRATKHSPRPHGPSVPLRRNPQSARIAGVSACSPPGNISAPDGV
jgi:hypothetical protein